MKLLIRNGRVVHPVTDTVLLQDILVENGRVALLERGLEAEADQVVDAAGLVVCPGLVLAIQAREVIPPRAAAAQPVTTSSL